MKVWSWEDVLSGAPAEAAPAGGYAATIGVFDGLHLGHKALVDRVVAQSPARGPLAVTFRANPKKTTAPSRLSGDIFTLDQKLTALETAGVEGCVLIDFSGNFSKLAGNEFVSILVRSCGVRSFVIGSDFKCGYRLSTDARSLALIASSLGASADIVEPVLLDGIPVSSSRIRQAIADGRTDLAFAMLGRPYTLDLRGFDLESDGARASVAVRHKGLVEPAAGTYEAVITAGPESRTASAVYGSDGRLSWPEGRGPGADFIALGAKIA